MKRKIKLLLLLLLLLSLHFPKTLPLFAARLGKQWTATWLRRGRGLAADQTPASIHSCNGRHAASQRRLRTRTAPGLYLLACPLAP